MPHLYPAETITYMKSKGMKPAPYSSGNDRLYLYSLLGGNRLRLLCVAHEAMKKSCIKRGIPEEKILTFGIPVAKSCRRKISREAAREKLGLDQQGKYFLAAGGSMGAGDLQELVEKLLEETVDEKILVICGSNQKAEQKLKKRFSGEGRVTDSWIYHTDAFVFKSLRRSFYKTGRSDLYRGGGGRDSYDSYGSYSRM